MSNLYNTTNQNMQYKDGIASSTVPCAYDGLYSIPSHTFVLSDLTRDEYDALEVHYKRALNQFKKQVLSLERTDEKLSRDEQKMLMVTLDKIIELQALMVHENAENSLGT